MKENYYAVTVKFGHVGRHKYIIKTIPVKAENAKEAANIARWTSRVKHHLKDAIISVNKLDDEQYELLRKEVKSDPYFHCSCIQEQREKCKGIEEDVQNMQINEIDFEARKQKRKNRVNFKNKMNKIIKTDYQYMIRNYDLAMSC